MRESLLGESLTTDQSSFMSSRVPSESGKLSVRGLRLWATVCSLIIHEL